MSNTPEEEIPASSRRTQGTNTLDKGLWRDLTAYWILGLCNNYGYVVMLSAAHDILSASHAKESTTPKPSNPRDCNYISTGAILLADIIPALIIKFTAPFLPFYVHIRILICCFASAAGYLLVSFSKGNWLAILGVVSTAFSSGLGEVTFLAYSAKYNRNVISTWSSGTGGAGIVGAVSYAGLISLGLTPFNTLLIMLIIPVLQAFSFWILLRKQSADEEHPAFSEIQNVLGHTSAVTFVPSRAGVQSKPLSHFRQKLAAIPPCFKYMIPLLVVYLFEYFINQGLFELVYYDHFWLSKSEQYRWLQVDYQVGVFISRSSVNVVHFKQVWLMSVFQFINVLILLFEVIYGYIPNIWIVFGIVLWEGLLGGGAYVNTFYRMTHEIPMKERKFSMGITALADSLGIAIAGWIAIPAHNALCTLPKPS